MFCSHCSTKNPENSAYCFNCGQKIFSTKSGQPPLSNDALTLARTRALAKVLVAREEGLATEADVERVTQEIQKDAAQVKKERGAAPSPPFHGHFFTAVDRNGMTRFFDLMQDEDGFSIAETATTANRLGECRESVYEVRGGAALHHVHRIYGGYSMAEAGNAYLAMQNFANFYCLTEVMAKGETLNQLEATPIWDEVFQKLGCPTGPWSLKTRLVYSE